MITSLATAPPPRHVFGVTEPTDTETEIRLLGQALAMLREAAQLTQEEAGARAKPAFTRQAWHLHEAGKVKGILTPNVQMRLLAALGATPEAFRLARDRIAEHGHAARVSTRSVSGLEERAARAYEGRPSGHRQAVFPTSEGDVSITYPQRLSGAALDELEAYLTTFIRTARIRTAN